MEAEGLEAGAEGEGEAREGSAPVAFGGVASLDALSLGLVALSVGAVAWMAPQGVAEGVGGLLLTGLAMGGATFAVAAHWRLGAQRLYWSGFDLFVLLLFAWIAAGVVLGESPEVTWPAVSTAGASLAGWLVGRLTGWRRFSWMLGLLAVGCVVAAFGAEATGGVAGVGAGGGLFSGRFAGMGGVMLVLGLLLFAGAAVFSMVRRPPAGMGGLLVLSGLFVVFVMGYREVVGLLDGSAGALASAEAWRQAAALLMAYPVAGVGWGAWPLVGGAWSQGPGVLMPPGGDFVVAAMELGPLAGAGLAGFLVLLPVAAWRSRRAYPFRRMRLAVGLMQFLLLFLLAAGALGSTVVSGAAGVVLWCLVGCLSGMFQVRDPGRAFGGSLVLGGSERRGVWGTLVRLTLILGAAIFSAIPGLAQWLAGRADGREPLRALERAVAVWPMSSDLQLRLADALIRGSREAGRAYPDVRTSARITAAYEAAVRANPYNPAAHEALYFWHRDANDPARALEAIRAGVRYNPASTDLRLLLVRELERGGSLALASHHLRMAALRTSGTDQAALMLQLAELYEQRGLRDQARRWWQYAQQADDLSEQARQRLRRLGERLQLVDPLNVRR